MLLFLHLFLDGAMNRFFEFSPAQLRVVLFLLGLLVVLSVLRFLRGYADPDERSFSFSVEVGDNDTRYAPLFKIDLNLSPADSLELLPGIGPVLASRIIAYRDSARFEEPEDIMRVVGIGHKTYERLKTYLEVRRW